MENAGAGLFRCIGLGFHIWDVYVGSNPSEEAIQAEIERMSRR